jgi:hypothetical protein
MFNTQVVLQAAVTRTATINSTGVDLGADFAAAFAGLGTPAVCDVVITAIDRVTGDETYAFTLQHSDDNVTFVSCGAAPTSPTAVGTLRVTGFVNKRYARLALVAAGTTPSVTFSAALTPLDASGEPGVPTFSGGTDEGHDNLFSFTGTLNLTLTPSVESGKVVYTTDGSDPRSSHKALVAAGTVPITANTTVRAVTVASGRFSLPVARHFALRKTA